jgi:hypothetical protein
MNKSNFGQHGQCTEKVRNYWGHPHQCYWNAIDASGKCSRHHATTKAATAERQKQRAIKTLKALGYDVELRPRA